MLFWIRMTDCACPDGKRMSTSGEAKSENERELCRMFEGDLVFWYVFTDSRKNW